MYDGVMAMISAEKDLEKAAGGAPAAGAPAAAAAPATGAVTKCGPHLKKIEDITGMLEFPAD